MSEHPNPTARYGTTAGRAGVAIDAGLRDYMLRVYNYMALGLAITGAAALGTFMLAVDSSTMQLTDFGKVMFASPLKWVVILAPLALVFFISFRIDRLSVGTAQSLFWFYAALMGVSLSILLLVFTGQSVVRTFFITAAAFGALSLYGYTTQRDLSAFGAFLIMGLFGLIIAMLVNIFLASSMMQWIISMLGVLIFSGLTAYDTQRIKEIYFAGDEEVVAGRKAIMGALTLYLDFLNLFVFLLQLIGDRR